MKVSPIDRRLSEKGNKRHTTAFRTPPSTWQLLLKLSEMTGLSVNEILNAAVAELLQKESVRLAV